MNAAKIKKEFETDEEFVYRLSDDVSFCPLCKYPVIISDEESPRKGCIFIVCVNGCFRFHVRRAVLNKFTMDNIMDLYKMAILKDDESHIRFLTILDFGEECDPHIAFSCYQCVVDKLQKENK